MEQRRARPGRSVGAPARHAWPQTSFRAVDGVAELVRALRGASQVHATHRGERMRMSAKGVGYFRSRVSRARCLAPNAHAVGPAIAAQLHAVAAPTGQHRPRLARHRLRRRRRWRHPTAGARNGAVLPQRLLVGSGLGGCRQLPAAPRPAPRATPSPCALPRESGSEPRSTRTDYPTCPGSALACPKGGVVALFKPHDPLCDRRGPRASEVRIGLSGRE